MTFPPLQIRFYPQAKSQLIQKDIATQQQIYSKILQLVKQDDLVVVASGYHSLRTPNPTSKREIFSALQNNIGELSKELQKRRASLVLMTPRPYFTVPKEYEDNPTDYTTLNCVFFPGWKHNCVLSANRKDLKSSLRGIDEILANLGKANPNVFVYDQFDALCPEGREQCSTLLDGRIAFYDNHHLNNHGSELLYPSFRNFLDAKHLLK